MPKCLCSLIERINYGTRQCKCNCFFELSRVLFVFMCYFFFHPGIYQTINNEEVTYCSLFSFQGKYHTLVCDSCLRYPLVVLIVKTNCKGNLRNCQRGITCDGLASFYLFIYLFKSIYLFIWLRHSESTPCLSGVKGEGGTMGHVHLSVDFSV